MKLFNRLRDLIKLYTTGIGPMPIKGLSSRNVQTKDGPAIDYYDPQGRFVFRAKKGV